MKRVFIIHGWDGFPEECWFPWLKQQLEEQGVKADVPAMPDAAAPNIEKWVSHLASQVGEADEETYFVGHSIGVQTILRYLETIDQKVGGVVSVAGFFTLKPDSFEDEEDKKTAEPWLIQPIDDEKVKNNAGKIIAIFSDDDPYVDLENVEMFEKRLSAKTIVLNNKGHMGHSEGLKELPVVLDELKKMMS